MDKHAKLMRIGIGGSAVTAVCCFTPLLAASLAAFGAAAWVGYLDYVLFPMLATFLGITAYAWQKRRQAQACRTLDGEGGKR